MSQFPMQIRPEIAQATLMLLQRVQIKPQEIPMYQEIEKAMRALANPQVQGPTPAQAGRIDGGKAHDNTRVPEAG